jgi:hypothetical protein
MEPSAISVVCLLAFKPSAKRRGYFAEGDELGPAGFVAFGPSCLSLL